jgi:hypothetical protein
VGGAGSYTVVNPVDPDDVFLQDGTARGPDHAHRHGDRMPMTSDTGRALRLAVLAAVVAALGGCFTPPPAAPPVPPSTWHAACPIDAATVSSIVGMPMQQTTPESDTPWCQFMAADNDAVLVVNLDDRQSVWGRTLPEARRTNAETLEPTCSQAEAPALGPDAFTYECAPGEKYNFYTATALFEMNGSIKEVGINKDYRRPQPTNLADLATAVAQRVRG